jgi:hypothetical protein
MYWKHSFFLKQKRAQYPCNERWAVIQSHRYAQLLNISTL